MHGASLFISEMTGIEKDTKRGGKDGQRLLCKEGLSRVGPFSLERLLLRKRMSELLNVMEDVETSIGNDVHCLTDTGTTKHLVNLPGGRFKTLGNIQCMISCGVTCCRTLQVVSFCAALRKTRQSQSDIFSRSNKYKVTACGSRSQCPLSFIHFTAQKTFGLACECYRYRLMVMSQSCRFQKREETSANGGLHLVPHYQPSDR